MKKNEKCGYDSPDWVEVQVVVFGGGEFIIGERKGDVALGGDK
jgi:hypothetical protein